MKNIQMIVRILLGNLLMAVAVNMLIVPSQFIAGGSTGFALIIMHFIDIPYSLIVTGLNVVMFLIGFAFLGKKFALTTLISTIIYPLFISATGFLETAHLVSDPLIAAIMAGVLMGCGLGLVIQSGASTGGLDIPPIILQRKLGWNVSVTMNIMDLFILAYQITYSGSEQIICGLTLVFVTYFIMNQVMTSGRAAFQLMIMSNETEKIRELFIHVLDKGATLFLIEGGYEQKEKKAVCALVERRELYAVQKEIYDVDPNAFVIISKVSEVHGLGFKPLARKPEIFG
ncbi:YitT family protein [uncultured Dubosiella sp.]|nr:YitT family protein [uncultured Dubosiella sp.]GJM58173.1 membrane protein [Erysipelotrichaceae bacterium OPF54]